MQVRLTQDVFDSAGTLFVPAGTVVEVLDIGDAPTGLIEVFGSNGSHFCLAADEYEAV